ncbi:MAG: pilus assembly protein [Cohnella sp.]|nr:pilus assembly protein [Cohnella sp.]
MKGEARRSLRRDCSGGFALEASMVLPWVMICAVLALLFALYVSLHSQIYYSASIAAERAAFGWSNSAKDARTGAYSAGRYDGLYWRLKDDALLRGWLGMATEDGSVSVPIEIGSSSQDDRSATGKLMKIGAVMPGFLSGSIEYRNTGIQRTVTVKAHSGWLPDALVKFRGQRSASAGVSALVVEPTELIRTFDLIRYYSAKMKEAHQGEDAFLDEAAGALRKRRT